MEKVRDPSTRRIFFLRSNKYSADSLFAGGDHIYLYSEFGENGVADDGFEEWGVGVGGAIVPEPATMVLLGLGGLLLRKRK